MKTYITLFCILCFSISSFAQLDIKLLNVKSTKGKLIVSIYDSESNFKSKKALSKTTIAANSEEMRYLNNNLKPGYYAVTVFHDLNNNDTFDKSFVGRPKEPYGVSNNAKEKFGPPKYEKVKFYYNGTSKVFFINLN